MNARDGILEVTTSKSQIATEDQLRRAFDLSRSGAAEARRQLLRVRLVAKTTVLSPLPQVVEQPICTWPGRGPPPDLSRVSYVAIRTWNSPLRQLIAFYATDRAANLTGGSSGKPTTPFQSQHNLKLTEVFLTYRRNWPELAECWVLPDLLPKQSSFRQGRVPDAFLLGPDGLPVRAIEVVGAYPVARLERLHLSCLNRQLAYELW